MLNNLLRQYYATPRTVKCVRFSISICSQSFLRAVIYDLSNDKCQNAITGLVMLTNMLRQYYAKPRTIMSSFISIASDLSQLECGCKDNKLFTLSNEKSYKKA